MIRCQLLQLQPRLKTNIFAQEHLICDTKAVRAALQHLGAEQKVRDAGITVSMHAKMFDPAKSSFQKTKRK